MHVIKTIEEIRHIIASAQAKKKKIGFVPTMGDLHAGHLSLLKISQQHCDFHVMSIFVNKIQFNDPADYQAYNRRIDADLAKAEQAGANLVFLPDDETMYHNHLTYVETNSLDAFLCGKYRPGHFKGVTTIVAKLFNIVQPDIAIFGQKDLQQAIIIEKMVFDLNFPVQIVLAPIVREKNGLAMSSRNSRLSQQEWEQAATLHEALSLAETLIQKGEYSGTALLQAIEKVIVTKGRPDNIEYVTLVDYATLQPTDQLTQKCAIALAVYFGPTRLIDNMILEQHNGGISCTY